VQPCTVQDGFFSLNQSDPLRAISRERVERGSNAGSLKIQRSMLLSRFHKSENSVVKLWALSLGYVNARFYGLENHSLLLY
jgi:hypothetical protein